MKNQDSAGFSHRGSGNRSEDSYMKASVQGTVLIGTCLLLASSTQSFAIEGLRLSVQCSNVVLSWPCQSDASESYIVQYRPSLAPGTPWQTLTSSLYSEQGTNTAYFVHENIVTNADCGGGDSFAAMEGRDPLTRELACFDWGVPLATRSDGTGGIVPLAIYPPGFDISSLLIFDPASADWLNGSDYRHNDVIRDGPLDPPPPPGGGGGGGGGSMVSETGFYRVVRNGVHIVGITNGMTLSGTVTFPVEVGTESGNVVAMSLREEGSVIGDSAVMAPLGIPLHLTLDTTKMRNGTHQISAFASWNSGGDEGSGVGIDEESKTYAIIVANEIAFPNWIDHFGELSDSLLITAESAHLDADWYVHIYGSEAGYIGTFGDHTTDGQIYTWWDLVGPPPNYTVYNTERYFDFEITTVWSGARGLSSAITRTYRQTDNWTSKGMWVVANQQAWEDTVAHEALDIASDGFAGMAEDFGLTVRPQRPYHESFRIGYGADVPESTRNSQWVAMRNALYHQESRNLFYFGHGDPTGIGGSQNTNRFITAVEIASMLHTIPAGQTNRHSYRFVMLYGCETASGTLPEAFGIIHRENVPGIDYVNAALTPGAFIGWNKKQSASVISSTLLDNARFLQHFQYEWLTGHGVSEALDRAKNNYGDVGFINRSRLKVFGNWNLRPLDYNR